MTLMDPYLLSVSVSVSAKFGPNFIATIWGILGRVVGRDIFSAILAKFSGDLAPEEGSRGEREGLGEEGSGGRVVWEREGGLGEGAVPEEEV